MEQVYIDQILVHHLRHLYNITIPLSNTERKHLILTGKNGSGKTSLLNEIKTHLKGLENRELTHMDNLKQNIIHYESMMKQAKGEIERNPESELIHSSNIESYKTQINNSRKQIDKYNNISLLFSQYPKITGLYSSGYFITTFFGAKRNLNLTVPKGIQKISLKDVYGIEEKVGNNFIQYIVNLQADRSFSREEHDLKAAAEIDLWFLHFENALKDIFGEEFEGLEFDRKNYNFNIRTKNREIFDLTTLSDGYSSILNIVTELILRMENKSAKSYNIQGIVLIDEIETHLHIELQKKILPFLTKFFPQIQFIVSTHSPFVLSSIANAVVYDLERNILVNDLTGYSADGLIESYFDSDKYSAEVKSKVVAYEKLLSIKHPSDEELEELYRLKNYFKELPKFMSPELSSKIIEIELLHLKK